MTKTALLLLACAVFLIGIPAAFWMKMESDAHAAREADPEHQRMVASEQARAAEDQESERLVAILALKDGGVDGTAIDRKRVAFLIQDIAAKYSVNLLGACKALVLVRTELAKSGVDQPCIPIMEAINFSRDWSRENVDTFSAKLAIYMTGRKAGRSHDFLVQAMSN